MEAKTTVTGIAQLCFFPSWFQGHLLVTGEGNASTSPSTISLLGTPADPESHPQPHPCCPPSVFWRLQARDWERGLQAECIVQQRLLGGDAAALSSVFIDCEESNAHRRNAQRERATVEFETTCVKVDQDAATHMERFFTQLTPSRDAVICLGEMRIEDMEFEPF
ncbi:hypothetical protein HDU87_005143 [Geranomyces variabilis]|uniref:Uncharacterized protein n=1 Tax=Geranomyces variabilis TaxID=109894 RepID=A0AAD5XTG5_9FUNG|nr:hypothetical protein HDU87_005143 [Geranomyces variabilis]